MMLRVLAGLRMQVLIVLLSVLSLFIVSCAMNNASLGETFQSDMKTFNRMVRWQDGAQAAMLYSDPAVREVIMKSAEGMRKRGVTITDFRVVTTECLPEQKTARAVLEFDYYTLPSNRIKTATHDQKWHYVEQSGQGQRWKLATPFPSFE